MKTPPRIMNDEAIRSELTHNAERMDAMQREIIELRARQRELVE